MKRLLASLLAAVCFAVPIFSYDSSARGAVLYDCLTGTVLWEKQGDRVMGMASTTKIMTALTALELYDPAQIVTVRPEWTGIEGSSMYLRVGERLTAEQLLYGLMLMSGNDAAAALAGLHPDGQAGFVAEMNQKAAAMGLSDTHFDNPSGLDGETHHTTARDLARLTAAALENPAFAAIVGTRSATVAGRYMKNHNRLLFQLEGCIGVKTGFTKACGRCLVSAVQRQGRRFIAVTLGDPDDWRDHTVLYEDTFARLQATELLPAGLYGSVPVVDGSRSSVGLEVREPVTLALCAEELEQITWQVTGPRFLYAPVEAGQKYGTVTARLKDAVILEKELYCVSAVDQLPEPDLRQRIQIWWESR